MSGMSEATLKTRVIRKIKETFPHWYVIAHHERTKHGVPDLSITGEGVTIWLELKYAKPALHARSIQDVTCQKLANAGGNCYYLIFFEAPRGRETIIATPGAVFNDTWITNYEMCVPDFNFEAIMEWLAPLNERTRGRVGHAYRPEV